MSIMKWRYILADVTYELWLHPRWHYIWAYVKYEPTFNMSRGYIVVDVTNREFHRGNCSKLNSLHTSDFRNECFRLKRIETFSRCKFRSTLATSLMFDAEWRFCKRRKGGIRSDDSVHFRFSKDGWTTLRAWRWSSRSSTPPTLAVVRT